MKHAGTDIVVVGTGIAGLTFALKAAEHFSVTVISKDTVMESNSMYAQGGIAANVHEDDSVEAHIADTLRVGGGINNTDAVRQILERSSDAISFLESQGVQFKRKSSGYDAGIEGGHTHRRILHVEDATGAHIMGCLIKNATAHPNITIRENIFVIDLIMANGVCGGVKTLNEKGKIEAIPASITMLATGGIGAMFEHTTNPSGATADGVAIAYRAGAVISDIEFVQFHPTALHTEGNPHFLLSETLRGEGAKLVTENDEPFMYRYHKDADLAPRDVVSRAILMESQKQTVYLDARGINPHFFQRRFPMIYRTLIEQHIDCSKDKIPVIPAAHYLSGGVKVDKNGRTSIKNMYASGETANTGLHGANRLASNSLLEGVVVSLAAAEHIALTPLSSVSSIAENTTMEHSKGDTDSAKLSKIMWEHAGVVRTESSLKIAQQKLQSLPVPATVCTKEEGEYRNMLQVARLLVYTARARKETRGTHYREDYPTTDPQWKTHIELCRHV